MVATGSSDPISCSDSGALQRAGKYCINIHADFLGAFPAPPALLLVRTMSAPKLAEPGTLCATAAAPSPGTSLERLVWRYGKTLPGTSPALATGFTALDRVLPQRGWFADGLNELLGNEQGAGEFSLLLPALKTVCAAGQGVLLANPPFVPYAPALEQAGLVFAHLIVVRNADTEQLYWAAEQALRSKACGAVVVWSDESARALPDILLRRLHIAAHTGACAGFLFRPRRAKEQASPAPLRIVYAPREGQLELTVHKCRGLSGTPRVCVQPWRHAWAARPLPAAVPQFGRPAHRGSPRVVAEAVVASASGSVTDAVAKSVIANAVATQASASVTRRVRSAQVPGHNSGDGSRAGCIEAGATAWRGFPLQQFAKPRQERR